MFKKVTLINVLIEVTTKLLSLNVNNIRKIQLESLYMYIKNIYSKLSCNYENYLYIYLCFLFFVS
jgi:hypothetical protein